MWQNLGLSFVIVLAGLQAVPEEVLEAATLDGYGPVRRFLRIIVPLISPVLMFLAVVLVVFGFQAYAQIDFLTSGGPAGSTETLVFKIFQKNTPDTITVGSVMSVGLFVLTFFVVLLQFVDPRSAGALWPLTSTARSRSAPSRSSGSRRCGRRTGRCASSAGT